MGCVFSSPSTSESRSKKPSSSTITDDNNGRRRRRRSTEERAASTDVGARNGAAEKERRSVINKRASHSAGADFPASSTTVDRRKPRVDPCMVRNQQGWPAWLVDVAGDVIKDWTPRRANTFEKLSKVLNLRFSLQNRVFNSRFQKRSYFYCWVLFGSYFFCSQIGQGTYSNVYKAKDLISGKIVALKKVRFDNLEPESVKFMAREILVLRKLDHPNVVKLEGLVTSRMSCSLYLVFEYMEHDLAGLVACQGLKFTEPQVCFLFFDTLRYGFD